VKKALPIGLFAILIVLGACIWPPVGSAAVDSNNYNTTASIDARYKVSKTTGALLVQDVGSDLVLSSAKRITVPATDANFVKDMGITFPAETAAVLFIPEQAPDTPISTITRWEITGSNASPTTSNGWAGGGQMIRIAKTTVDKLSVVSSGAAMTGSFQVYVPRS
jgi:hypothetical protein